MEEELVQLRVSHFYGNLTFHVKSWKAEEKRVLAKVDYGRYSG